MVLKIQNQQNDCHTTQRNKYLDSHTTENSMTDFTTKPRKAHFFTQNNI